MLRDLAIGALVLALGAMLGNGLYQRTMAQSVRVTGVATEGALPEGGTDGATPADTAKPSPATPELAIAVQDLKSFVEQARGLRFKEPVDVALLADAAFDEKLSSMADMSAEEVERAGKVLRALALLERETDLQEVRAEALKAVVGVYDPESKKLLLRGTKLNNAVRRTLVHELTHALDDQWFGLHRPKLGDDDESRDAFRGLIEGSAERIEAEWMATLSYEERLQANSHPSGGESYLSASIQPAVAQALAFPYLVGPPFVSKLLTAGGQALLDETFASPPRTSEQLMHPDRFLAGDAPKSVATPVAGAGQVLDRGVMGELGLLQVLHPLGATAVRAAEGWGGDRYVAWDEGTRTCVRANVVMDTQRDTTELVSAIEALASKRPGVTVVSGAVVSFTSCG